MDSKQNWFGWRLALVLSLLGGWSFQLQAQAPTPPIPVEVLAGDEALFYQLVVKRSFNPGGKFDFFGLATYTTNYDQIIADNRMITIAQLSYQLGKGLGIMAGADMNSFAGFAPVLGTQHNFANRKWLAVTVASVSVTEEKDFKLLGLYEYKPPINEKWSVYSRFQFIYNHSLQRGVHNKSYIYLRAGLQRNSLAYGLGGSLDWSGPGRIFQDNYGLFVRWEFR